MLVQEVRSVIAVAEAKQTDKPPPPGGRGPEGPDTRTCNRLVQHLLDAGEVTLARLQYNQELVATTREVRGLVPRAVFLRCKMAALDYRGLELGINHCTW